MIEDMTIRNLSPATQQSYIYAVAKFSRHFNSSPAKLGMEEVRAYQLHLVEEKHSWSHINQVACALRFFYGITLGQKEVFERIVFGKEPAKLPPVLNAEELVSFLEAVTGLRNRVALTTAYAAGLRVGEAARLKVTSIDSERMLILIENGKGGKDRYAMLSPRLLEILRAYWRRVRPGVWSRSGPRRSCQPGHVAGGLPDGAAASRAAQARHRPCAAAQFRHASPGKRRRHPHHSGAAWVCRSFLDNALCASRHQLDRQHAKSVRSPLAYGDPARLSGAHAR